MEGSSSTYTVLVSRDGGNVWGRHGGIVASSVDAAIAKVRGSNRELVGDPDALFYATSSFTPRKMEKELVEKWSLQRVDLDAGEEADRG